MSIIIHGVNASPFVRKVRVALAEKGIAYELKPKMPFGPDPEFRKISPLGKIPVLQDGDFFLPDSSCILAYLERTNPQPALYPSDPKQYGRALFLEEYGDSKLVEALGTVFFERIVKGRIMKQPPDEARIRQALTEATPPLLDWLETQAPTEGDGIVGGRFSVADLGLCSPFVNWMHAGERIDAGRWPKLRAYVDRVWARPSFKACIEEEQKQFAAM